MQRPRIYRLNPPPVVDTGETPLLAEERLLRRPLRPEDDDDLDEELQRLVFDNRQRRKES